MIAHPIIIDPAEPATAKARLKTIPRRPGVYLMKDDAGKVIYIGKAKNLRNRLRTYFNGGDGRLAIPFLVSKICELETIVTEDEEQALVLENDLIKKHRPRYNVRLKDDRAYLIVRIDTTHEWPRIELVRQTRNDDAKYLGPFPWAHEVRRLLDIVRETVPLRTCSDRVIYNRVRPCLEHQMKRCAGPCCLKVDHAQYREWVDIAASILEGKNKDVLRLLSDQMERASEQLRFEDAAELRDRMALVKTLIVDRPMLSFSAGSKDAFGIHREGSDLELSVLFVRNGRLFGAKTFGFSDVEVPTEDVLGSVLSQFYASDNEVPEEILVPFALEDRAAREEFYSNRRGRKVKIQVPQRGSKQRLLTLAAENATENFVGRFAAERGEDSIGRALQVDLGLDEAPRTMECVDVSHFQGGATVGSVVFFKDGQPDKTRYRHFHLSQEGKPDDFASMREIVTRHLSRCAEENTLVDLMVIDGGPAQLAQALAVRKELGLRTPMLIGLAKKRTESLPYYALAPARRPDARHLKPERVYVEEAARPIVLKESSKALHVLERIRNEAHRFAVSFHRSTRARRQFQSPLERIPGIGRERRMTLLREFGGLRQIAQATPEEISQRAGFPIKLAERVHQALSKMREENG
ncbi:MAG: excinuclease ABC subunit UvrC [Deltaproteobacteria bacterium]|nr:excinuclease ABC subunit UvrC [Deltaproteobacteria bacterium]